MTLSNSFLTETVETCVATRGHHRRVMEGMVRAGIGPWPVCTFGPGNRSDLALHGCPARFPTKLRMASFTGSVSWEIVEPLESPSIHREFPDRRGEGTHRTAFACGDMP